MKIVNSYPPNYELINNCFRLQGRSGVIFTYGDTIYNPSGIEIAPDLIIHEETHQRQQAALGVDNWWELYLNNREFRLEQEIEAYRNQYAFAKSHYGRDQRRKLLDHIAKTLAGPLYGNLMSPKQAKEIILNG